MAKGKPKVKCEFTSQTNHSGDIVEVYFGTPEPAMLCGFHASEGLVKSAIAFVSGVRNGS